MTTLVTFAAEEAHYYLSAVRYWLGTARNKKKRKILVNGVPKSGTTWLYRMILSVPGYSERGNFRGNINAYDSVQQGDVVHGHDWITAELSEKLRANNIQVVLVVRDLRDQSVSRMFHLKRDETHAWQPTIKQLNNDDALMLSIEGRDPDGELPILPGVTAWKTFTRQWLAANPDIT
ncbi:MAG: sulfotransferase domain-containing protein, partial [Candidatus Promineifilaceae bacterium]